MERSVVAFFRVYHRLCVQRAWLLHSCMYRELHKLREQIEKLTAAATTVDENWADKLAKAEGAAARRVEQLQADIADLKMHQVGYTTKRCTT